MKGSAPLKGARPCDGNGRIRTFGGYQPRWFSRPVHSSALPRFQMPTTRWRTQHGVSRGVSLLPAIGYGTRLGSVPRQIRTDTRPGLNRTPLPVGLEGQDCGPVTLW